jgi:hypothetical protein
MRPDLMTLFFPQDAPKRPHSEERIFKILRQNNIAQLSSRVKRFPESMTLKTEFGILESDCDAELLKWAGLDSNLISQGKSNKELSKNTNSKRVHNSEICPKLGQIITAWPSLSEKVKKRIMALIATK